LAMNHLKLPLCTPGRSFPV